MGFLSKSSFRFGLHGLFQSLQHARLFLPLGLKILSCISADLVNPDPTDCLVDTLALFSPRRRFHLKPIHKNHRFLLTKHALNVNIKSLTWAWDGSSLPLPGELLRGHYQAISLHPEQFAISENRSRKLHQPHLQYKHRNLFPC